MVRYYLFSILALVVFGLVGCATSEPPAPTATTAPTETTVPSPAHTATEAGPFTLTSTSFAEGEEIPTRYIYSMPGQCDGENVSPELSWSGEPTGTQSFTFSMIDAGYVHWVQFNIPADVHQFEEVVGGPDIGVKALNLFGEFGYSGPCPPSGTRTYVFTLYALDTTLDLSPASTWGVVENAMEGHVLEEVELVGVRSGD
jgi:Raf kinase inhibitor-like YbhB/YbcL family protein